MRLRAMALLVTAVCSMMGGHAHAETTVTVLETYPSGDEITLGPNQSYYVRIAYSTDTPVHIWVNPYFRGKPTNAGSNPSGEYIGAGEAFGWFFLSKPGVEVDEVRIKVGDGSYERTPVLATLRVHVVGSAVPVAAREPAWVASMKRRAADEERRDFEARMREPATGSMLGDVAFFGGFMLVMAAIGIGAVVMPIRALRRWQGGWWYAALVAIAPIAFVVLRIAFDVARDPTSHNLWPFEIVQIGVVSLVLLAIFAIARKATGASRP
ncbi:MAG TPA: hypothetical protein VG736_07775 [Vicinamibacterales bacterium]|jgi:hypothetical protein|nr:hypothetical protein [Vicinamibacterales bacterium]